MTRTEYDGTITVLADSFDGRRLNAPNDVIVMSDGAVWFTDPGYGIVNDYEGRKAEAELETAVYRIDPDSGELELDDRRPGATEWPVHEPGREPALRRGFRLDAAPHLGV